MTGRVIHDCRRQRLEVQFKLVVRVHLPHVLARIPSVGCDQSRILVVKDMNVFHFQAQSSGGLGCYDLISLSHRFCELTDLRANHSPNLFNVSHHNLGHKGDRLPSWNVDFHVLVLEHFDQGDSNQWVVPIGIMID